MGPFRSIITEAWEKTFILTKFFCFLHVTDTYLINHVMTYGPSMLPAIDLSPTDFLAERISTRFGKLAQGDIVVLRNPQNPRKTVTKRLVGLEGDTITYVSSSENSDMHETVVVPKGHVWVQGDNTYNSNDSRHFGPVPYGLIESKLFWRVSLCML
uniref:Signal peptidase S24 n=1 Tax=Cicer arietinum TaxID=3827 RepID=A0A068BBP8_CICAR|nr:signal peptidase S24 [Cicer arietinum]